MRPSTYKFDEKSIRYYKALKKITGFLKHHIFLLVIAMACIGLFYTPLSQWNGFYKDADGYMRALRISHWLQNPSFIEQRIYESNYPFGEILHWTRPMDIIWLLISVPFWILSWPVKETLFICGAFLSPVLGVLCVIAITYGLRRRFNIYLTLLGAIIFLCNPKILSVFSPDRPDHHSLMLLLFTYSFSLVLCWLKKRQNRYLHWLGISLSLAAFTTIEGFILYTIFICFFLWLYIFKNISLTPTVEISKYFALSLIVFWLLNPPYEGLFYPDTGRLSILYVIASALAYLGFSLLQYNHLHSIRLKILSLLCIILGFILALLVIFGPDILTFPFNQEIKKIFLPRIDEMRSFKIFPLSRVFADHLFSLLAIIINICLLKKKPYQRLLALNLCLALPLFILTLYAIRFNAYSPTYCIIPFLILIDYIYRKSPICKNKNTDFPCSIWLIILLIISIEKFAPMAEYLRISKQKHPPFLTPQLCQQIKQIGGTLLTDIFRSPQYVWYCNVNTVGTPYHKNTQGIADTHKIFNAENDHQIIPQLLKHQITQIIVFEKYDNGYYPLSDKNKNKLYYKLIKRENIPPFLKEIPVSVPLAHLYEVKI